MVPLFISCCLLRWGIMLCVFMATPLGDPPQHIFSVKIASSKDVHFLREVTKEEEMYMCPADELVLYRTSKKVACWNDNDEDNAGLKAGIANCLPWMCCQPYLIILW